MQRARRWTFTISMLLAVLGACTSLGAFTLHVTDNDGTPVSGFRYLVEEDTTYPVTPGVPASDTLGVNIHKTYSPVAASGETAGSSVMIDVPPNKRYFVSVLPYSGHTMSGHDVKIGQGEVTVIVHEFPVETAQISVYAFKDNQPLNNAPDIPAEEGLPGVQIVLHDEAGQVMMDAFGNPLMTTYLKNPDGTFVLDGDGAPVMDQMGGGVPITDANGEVYIKYLAPNKYGIVAVAPPGEGWIQTTTIEGTPTIDAWVGSREPKYLAEFGFFAWHAFFGFAQTMTFPESEGTTGTITGQVVELHRGRPPWATAIFSGRPMSDAWVGLNNLSGRDEQVYAQPCDPETGEFVIENVPPGTYQLVVWDEFLDIIIDFRTVVMPVTGGLIALGDVPVNPWFGRLEGKVFYDMNENGFPDEGEPGLGNQGLNLRFTDGTIYQATATDPTGKYSFDEVFEFLMYIVPEVDFARLKATGVHVVVDDGGEIPPGENKNPQAQPDNGGLPWRTELGPVLTEAMMLYAGQTNEINWGKTEYGEGENGGISGVIGYGTTRAEDEPQYLAIEPWEPGIPRVQMNLYADFNQDKVIDDLDGDGGPTPADVDNYPFGNFPGPEDVDRNLNGAFDPGDAIQIGTSDSWDDNLPEGAVAPPQYVHGVEIRNGAETFVTWNQIRPGVFDGGYAFDSYFPGGIVSGGDEVDGLPAGFYIVECALPPGYEIAKEENKNVDFGDEIIPYAKAHGNPLIDPPVPVGDLHLVPAELTLFPGVPAPSMGELKPLADRKQVYVTQGRNAACDFQVFTEVPKAARVRGMCLNDVLLDWDPESPFVNDNYGVPWIPVAFRDHLGNEVARVYTDEWGRYNALLPSTYTVNLASPTGVSPNMVNICLNDPGPIPDPLNAGQYITDPWYDLGYGTACYRFQFYPGRTTPTDTPVLPIAGLRGSPARLDCEFPDATPLIYSISGPEGGPYVATAGSQITIAAVGDMEVPNPDYDPEVTASPTTIVRDYSFGPDEGTVTVDGVPLTNLLWAGDGLSIQATVPPGVATGQLMITRGDNGVTTPIGITLHVGDEDVVHVAAGQSIQDAVDMAGAEALILVAPGVYNEAVIMWKPVKLQGWGAFSTTIQAGPLSLESQEAWGAKLKQLVDGGMIDLISGQTPDFVVEEGEGFPVRITPGVMVAGQGGGFGKPIPRVDGLTIWNSTWGGGVLANAYASHLRVSNNRILSNQGGFGGGVRVGTPSLVNATGDGYLSCQNPDVHIHHNQISSNGAWDGGGGVAIFNGADNYRVYENYICGNFSLLYGGGIAHFGLSDGGIIENNHIFNNEAFDEGGGIMVAGELVPGGGPGTLSPGSGDVTIRNNVIQGNLSGDDGGGIRTLSTNGQDVQNYPSMPSMWYKVEILDNVIVNNVSADAGGGISLDDSARVSILNNTVAHNDSSATGVDAFGPRPELNNPPGQWLPPTPTADPGTVINSVPQVGGISARAHSTQLQDAFGPGFEQEFSNPTLDGNIIWQNRSFYWDANHRAGFGGIRPDIGDGESPVFWDLGVYQTAGAEVFNPVNGVLTDLTITWPDGSVTAYDASNTDADPLFADPYFNELLASGKGAGVGNFVSIVFAPTGLVGDYTPGVPKPEAKTKSTEGNKSDKAEKKDGAKNTGKAAAEVTGGGTEVLIVGGGTDDGGETTGDVGGTNGGEPALTPGAPGSGTVVHKLGAGDGFINMADGRPLYMFGFSNLDHVKSGDIEDLMDAGMLAAEFPGPTIVAREGDELYLELTNVGMMMRPDLFDPHTIHFHGFPQAASVFDGVPDASLAINMGATLTYYYNIVEPGTYMWHCHVEATEHMQMGMLANIYVLPAQDVLPDGTDLNGFTHHTGYKYAYNDGDGSTYYDVDYPVQMHSMDPDFHDASIYVQPLPFANMRDTYAMFNGRGYPDTIKVGALANSFDGHLSQPVDTLITAEVGEKILLRFSNLSTTDYFTVTALGLPMKVVGRGARLLRGPDGKDLTYDTTSITLGGGEAADVILDTAGLEPGTYALYTTNLNFLSNDSQDFGGMMTEIRLSAPGSTKKDK